MDLPSLTDGDRTELDHPIALEELQLVINEMASQKTPGPDGLPVEIYRQYGKVLLPELLRVLNVSMIEGALPPINDGFHYYKEGKDPLDVASYRPIALLNTDIKIFAKILAARLNKVIVKLIRFDQSGFMPGRTTSINIRRLFLNLQAPMEQDDERAVLSLDAAKAFDCLEWQYLWRAMKAAQLGPRFIGWVKMLYGAPAARVKVNNELSDRFSLGRGTRQGCPLSPPPLCPCYRTPGCHP